MDDPTDSTLERELASLKPNAVPDALRERMSALFSSAPEAEPPAAPLAPPTVENVVPFPLWRRAGAVAAVLVAGVGVYFAALNSFRTSTPAANALADGAPSPPAPVAGQPARKVDTYIPARAENIFEGVRDGGVVLDSNRVPVRVLDFQLSDSYQWENPEDGSTIRLTVPRERRYLVPVRTD